MYIYSVSWCDLLCNVHLMGHSVRDNGFPSSTAPLSTAPQLSPLRHYFIPREIWRHCGASLICCFNWMYFHPCISYIGILYLAIVIDFDLDNPGLHCLCPALPLASFIIRGECMKEFVELMKCTEKRRRDWASTEHVEECDMVSCLHNRMWMKYSTTSLLLSYYPHTL